MNSAIEAITREDATRTPLEPDRGYIHNGKLGIGRTPKPDEVETKHGIKIENRSQALVDAVVALIDKYPSIWDHKGLIKMREDEYMRIPLLENALLGKLAQKPFPHGTIEREALDKILDALHEEDRFEFVDAPTPFAAPAFIVYRTGVGATKKARMVIDLRALNRYAIPDAYPMPLQSDVIDRLRGKTWVSCVDASAFFHQFPVWKPDREKFTIVSHRGLERSKVALMGFKNSPAHVQRFMDKELRPHSSYATAFIDDIIIFSDSEEEHLKHLDAIFALFAERNIGLAGKKSFLCYSSVVLLGFQVDALGLHTTEARMEAVKALRFPRNLAQLEKWIGFTSWLRHLIPRYSKRTRLLQARKTELNKIGRESGDMKEGNKRKAFTNSTTWVPTAEEVAEFEDLKEALSQPTSLYHHDPSRLLIIQLDASKEVGFSAIVFQLDPSFDWDKKGAIKRSAIRPIMYLSKQCVDAELRYWPTELEVACLVWVLKRIRPTILSNKSGEKVVVLTDHSATKGLCSTDVMKTSSPGKANLRLINSAMFINTFDLDIIYLPGRVNIIADALSRLDKQEEDQDLTGTLDKIWDTDLYTFNETVANQALLGRSAAVMHPDLRARFSEAYKTDPYRAKDWETLHSISTQPPRNLFVQDGLLYSSDPQNRTRLCIPQSEFKAILMETHDMKHHWGEKKMRSDILTRFNFPQCRQEIRKYIEHCQTCQRVRKTRQKPLGELEPIETTEIPFHTIAMDFFSGIPEVPSKSTPWALEGFGLYDDILTVTDKWTKQTMIIPGNKKYAAEDWAAVFFKSVQMRNWGIPKAIISDRDPKFTSDFWKALWKQLGTSLLMSTSYHPQTDGLAERKNQVVEVAMRTYISAHPGDDWTHVILPLQYNLNNSFHTSIGCTPNELLMGTNLNDPLTLLSSSIPQLDRQSTHDRARKCIATTSAAMRKHYDQRHVPLEFQPGDMVMIRAKEGLRLHSKYPKMAEPLHGPYKVLERVGKLAYRLELPPNLRFHDVVSIIHLRPATDPDKDPYQRGATQPAPDIIEDDPNWAGRFQEWEIEAILDDRVEKRGGVDKRVFFVKWKLFDHRHNNWIVEDGLDGAQDMVREYLAKKKLIQTEKDRIERKKGPLQDLDQSQQTDTIDRPPAAPLVPEKRGPGRPRKQKPHDSTSSRTATTRPITAQPTPSGTNVRERRYVTRRRGQWTPSQPN
ncbi:hypothetical protein RB595_000061 [Gaeumannomyces hyphopodioides]